MMKFYFEKLINEKYVSTTILLSPKLKYLCEYSSEKVIFNLTHTDREYEG